MKGGGVKGLALVGALIELEKHFSFDVYVGTSAGAIAAVLLASGLDAPELERRLREQDFVEFLDKSLLAQARNLLLHHGLHTGNAFEQWVQNTLKEKLPREQKVEMRDLRSRAIIYAASEDKGTVTFDSHGENANRPASFAVRCSMSIPYFFIPRQHHGQPVFDGGLLNNFPVSIFLEQHPGHEFIGMYLSSGEKKESDGSMLGMLINIITGRDEKVLVDRYKDRMIVIDPSPIRTTQFSLQPAEKDFLVYQGRAAALQFLQKIKPSAALSDELIACTKRALHLREQIFASRRRQKQRKSLALASFAAIVVLAGYLGFSAPEPDRKQGPDIVARDPKLPGPGEFDLPGDPAKVGAEETVAEIVNVTFTPAQFPYAAAAGNLEAVQDLLTRGASVGQTTSDGYTALHLAARAGHLEIVRLLVGRKANVNTQSKAQETPLYLAAQDGRTPVVAYLLEQKGDRDMPALIGSGMFAITLTPLGHWENDELSIKVGRAVTFLRCVGMRRAPSRSAVRLSVQAGANYRALHGGRRRRCNCPRCRSMAGADLVPK